MSRDRQRNTDGLVFRIFVLQSSFPLLPSDHSHCVSVPVCRHRGSLHRASSRYKNGRANQPNTLPVRCQRSRKNLATVLFGSKNCRITVEEIDLFQRQQAGLVPSISLRCKKLKSTGLWHQEVDEDYSEQATSAPCIGSLEPRKLSGFEKDRQIQNTSAVCATF